MIENEVIVSGHQPCLLYYIGFWNKLWLSDIHFIQDDVPASKRDHTNRFKIKSPQNKAHYITVPVKEKKGVIINEIELSYNPKFEKSMKKTCELWYKNSEYFDDIYQLLVSVFEQKFHKLIDFNLFLFNSIMEYLNIEKKVVFTSEIGFSHLERSEKLAVLTKELGGTVFLSGMGGYKYIIPSVFQKHEIKLYFQEVKHPVWKQMHGGDFIEYLSILDLLFNEGPNSLELIKQSGIIKKDFIINSFNSNGK